MRKPVDALALSMMIVLCMCWGFNQITIKVAAAGISPIMQAGLRSIIATALLLAWAQLRGIRLFGRDGTIKGGASWAKGLPFGALSFNGKDAFVEGPTNLAIGAAGTLEVWCYPRAVGGGLMAWCLGTQWEDQRLILCFSTYKDQSLSGAISDGKMVDLVQEPVPAEMLNRWSHMVLRFDEQNIQLFRNGKPVTHVAPPSIVPSCPPPLLSRSTLPEPSWNL